tara:strand:- start:3096 stop:3398 length:303 start_codon:yes stop_codon:yes gene_type:complete
MAFTKGDTNINRGGRPLGSVNESTRITAKLREQFTHFIDDNFSQILEDFATLTPEQRVKMYLEFTRFCIPTMKATHYTNDSVESAQNQPITIHIIKGDEL